METITIGVTGEMASGKGMVAEVLKARGFECLSLSDEVRKETAARGLEVTRESLQKVGNSLRREFGGDVLARRTAARIKGKLVVIESIRNPEETYWLKENLRMKLVGVTAAPKTRFERLVERQRPGDPKTWQEFLRLEGRDRGEGEGERGQQVDACLALADVVVENNGTREELKEKLEKIVQVLTTTNG